MSEDALKKVLKDLNITDTEAEIYLYLSKYPLSKGTEISKHTKKDKAQIYHILKSLQTKRLVETTLEAPVRYTPVPFEKVVDIAIHAKREEAQRIEKTREELNSFWKTLNRARVESAVEKFVVIEGRKKIYAKISDMISQSREQICALTTVADLLRADQYGLYDVVSGNPFNSQVQFRFITELTSKNRGSVKAAINRLSLKGFNFRGKSPQFAIAFD